MQRRLLPVHDLRAPVEQPAEEVVLAGIDEAVELQLAGFGDEGARYLIGDIGDEIGFVGAGCAHGYAGGGRVAFWDAGVVKDSPNCDVGILDFVGAATDADAEPVVGCRLICIDNHVVALAFGS